MTRPLATHHFQRTWVFSTAIMEMFYYHHIVKAKQDKGNKKSDILNMEDIPYNNTVL